MIKFDLQKAYDTTWKYGIMQDLQKMGLKRQMPVFIREFLRKRSFKVKINNVYSDEYPQEEGVP